MVIETGIGINGLFEEAMMKLGFKVKCHPNPHHMTWIINTMLKVAKHCLVTLVIGKLKEAIMRDEQP